MSKKQIAAAVGAVLVAVAGVLSQCQDDAPVKPAPSVPADAGAH